jgi:hypothetical protein
MILDRYIIFKLYPIPNRCCCFHCLPQQWHKVNEVIYPTGPLKDEGSILINKNGGKFVIECHESGPEIKVFLDFASAGLNFVSSIVNIITIFINSKKGLRTKDFKFLLIKRRIIRHRVIEETLFSFQSQTQNIDDQLKRIISDTLKKEIKNSY